MDDKDIGDRVRLQDVKILSDDHYILRRADFAFQRNDGRWQSQRRESYDIGDAAAALLWDRARDKVVLVRQFRWPPYESGHHQLMIEVVAGKLDGDAPEDCIRREAMEEAGVLVTGLETVSFCFVSPGAVRERVWMYLAAYDSSAPRRKGGGIEDEAEDIEVVEMALDDAYAMIASGQIIDAKTILLLQAAKLRLYSPPG